MITKEKVTAGEVVASTIKYSNQTDSDRVFDIKAEVNVLNGKVSNINNGRISKKGSTEYVGGDFNCCESLNYFGFNANGLNQEEIEMAVKSALTFISDVKESIESKED